MEIPVQTCSYWGSFRYYLLRWLREPRRFSPRRLLLAHAVVFVIGGLVLFATCGKLNCDALVLQVQIYEHQRVSPPYLTFTKGVKRHRIDETTYGMERARRSWTM